MEPPLCHHPPSSCNSARASPESHELTARIIRRPERGNRMQVTQCAKAAVERVDPGALRIRRRRTQAKRFEALVNFFPPARLKPYCCGVDTFRWPMALHSSGIRARGALYPEGSISVTGYDVLRKRAIATAGLPQSDTGAIRVSDV